MLHPRGAVPALFSTYGRRPSVRLAALALSVLAACGPRGEAPSGDVLLLLTIDTLRADRLGCGGDPRARTPFLDRVARGGTQFGTAVAATPLTLPSHATILTGLEPPAHGARDNGLFRVSEEAPLVPSALEAAGWETAAFVAAYPLAARFGLSRGFETYREAGGVRREGSASSFPERTAQQVNDDLLPWLDARRRSDPLFFWVHYFDPHAPYSPPRIYRKIHGRDSYRGEITFTDRRTGDLLRALEERFETVRICVTADHGESLGQHGEESHGIFVYEATTRVPLLFRGDGFPAGTLRSAPASLAQVAPTIVEWAGLDPARANFPRPSLRTPADDSPVYVESLYPELRHGWSRLQGFRSPRWKVIRAPEPELYDLVDDPGETTNLHGTANEEAAALLASLDRPEWNVALAPGRPDPEVEAALRSLGYAGVAPSSPGGEDLPDPKDRVAIERHLGRITAHLEAGQIPAARNALSLALAVDEKNKEAHVLRARLEAASGNVGGALEILEWCLTIPPASADGVVHFAAGELALNSGQLPFAEESFARAVAADGLNVDAVYNWGLVAYREGRFQDAVDRWRRALTIDPGHAYANEWLADAQARARGDGS